MKTIAPFENFSSAVWQNAWSSSMGVSAQRRKWFPDNIMKSHELRLLNSIPDVFLEGVGLEEFLDYLASFFQTETANLHLWYKEVMSLSSMLTLRGLMMGFPMSWVLLPMVTLYCFEMSSYDKWIVLPSGMNVPLNWKEVETCGDDALMRMLPAHSDRHTVLLLSLDAEISPTKDVYTPDPNGPSVYLEYVRDRGKASGFIPLAPLSGAPGQSVTNWMNSASSFFEGAERVHSPAWRVYSLIRNCRWMEDWIYATKYWSIPVSYPYLLGGLGVPQFRNTIRKSEKDMIFTYYAELSTWEFFNPSLRLSCSPSARRSVGLSWARREAWDFNFRHIEEYDGTGIPAEDVWLILANPFFSAEIFSLQPLRERHPYLASHANRNLYQRIKLKRGKPFSASTSAELFLEEIASKHSAWQIRPENLSQDYTGSFGYPVPGLHRARFEADSDQPWLSSGGFQGGHLVSRLAY
jgi:hypothetical protein